MPLDPALEDAGPTDIIIPIMGATGAGKSTFINLLLEQIGDERRVMVGDQLTSCTVDPEFIVMADQIQGRGVKFKNLANEHRIVIVDTPGFDDPIISDLQILTRIAKLLRESLERGMVLGGVIYLHDISQDHVSDTARKNPHTFNGLIGEATFEKTVLVTTKWGRQGDRNFVGREEELCEGHWKEILQPRSGQGGAAVMRLYDEGGGEGASPWAIVTNILKQLDVRLGRTPPEDGQKDAEGTEMGHYGPYPDASGTCMLSPQPRETVAVQQQPLAAESYGREGDGELEGEQSRSWMDKSKASKRKRFTFFTRIRSFFRRVF